MDLTPQKQAFLKAYLDPKSPTWGNAVQSGLKAGYDEHYAKNILNQMPDWLRENLDKSRLVQKAEKNLEMALDGGLDEEGKKKDIQWKATDFALSRLKKDTYSERLEHTGKNGEAIELITTERDKIENAISNITGV